MRVQKYIQNKSAIKKNDKQQIKQIIQKQLKHDISVQKTNLLKNKMINEKKDRASSMKMSQESNVEAMKQRRQEQMLKLQAKHFGFDAKNVLNKLMMQHVSQTGQQMEIQLKHELSFNDSLNHYSMKPKKQQQDMSQLMDKFHSIEDGRPKGLKTMNKYRSPSVVDN